MFSQPKISQSQSEEELCSVELVITPLQNKINVNLNFFYNSLISTLSINFCDEVVGDCWMMM
jgi:hypothetical protein